MKDSEAFAGWLILTQLILSSLTAVTLLGANIGLYASQPVKDTFCMYFLQNCAEEINKPPSADEPVFETSLLAASGEAGDPLLTRSSGRNGAPVKLLSIKQLVLLLQMPGRSSLNSP